MVYGSRFLCPLVIASYPGAKKGWSEGRKKRLVYTAYACATSGGIDQLHVSESILIASIIKRDVTFGSLGCQRNSITVNGESPIVCFKFAAILQLQRTLNEHEQIANVQSFT